MTCIELSTMFVSNILKRCIYDDLFIDDIAVDLINASTTRITRAPGQDPSRLPRGVVRAQGGRGHCFRGANTRGELLRQNLRILLKIL